MSEPAKSHKITVMAKIPIAIYENSLFFPIPLNKLTCSVRILNPLNTLKRGYSITKKDNKVLTSIKNIKTNEMIEVNLSDGIINAKVNEIKEN